MYYGGLDNLFLWIFAAPALLVGGVCILYQVVRSVVRALFEEVK